jgi:hypothetical protein
MSLAHLKIKVYSHHFSATRLTARGKWLCTNFAKLYVQYSWEQQAGQFHRVPFKVYAAATDDREEYRFHIHQFDHFREFLENNFTNGSLIDWETEPEYEAALADFTVKAMWIPKDYQEPIIEYLIAPEPISKFVDLQTGRGKTFCALAGLSKFGKRFVIVIKPMYIDKWIEDLAKTYEGLLPEDVMVVKGSAALMKLMQLAQENALHCKVIIISNKTMQNYISEYEKYHHEILDMGYACAPYDLFTLLKVGARLIDELHQDWHFNYKLDLYTHVERSISLSATLLDKDPFISRMYEMAYPLKERFMGLALDKYIEAYSVHYRFNRPDKIRTEEQGGRGYAHTALEKSVMRNPAVLLNYMHYIDYILDIGFFNNPRAKKKVLIFAATVDMCTQITAYLKRKYPDRDVRRYVAEDPWSDLMEGEMIVSTLGSSGTAQDIEDLTNVVLTVAVSSIKSNIQSLGRLRKLKDDAVVQFHYAVCNDIPKHLDYDRDKRLMLSKRAKSFREIHSGHVI